MLGNPPYITYKDLENEEKTYIRANFSTCRKGKFDYYYAFVEDGLRSLQDHGILAYIIPSSIYKNVSANDLRALIKEDATDVYDYTSEKKFKNAVTSSTILVLKKNSGADHLRYHDVLIGNHSPSVKNCFKISGILWKMGPPRGNTDLAITLKFQTALPRYAMRLLYWMNMKKWTADIGWETIYWNRS